MPLMAEASADSAAGAPGSPPPQALPAFDAYSDEAAIEFYLGSGPVGEFQASTADAVFVVEGIALPVHVGAVMAPASGVFAKPAPASAVPLTYALGAEGQHLHIIASDTLPADDERSLHGLTLKRLAHFLRFVYEPSSIADLDSLLPGAMKSLSASAKLAHQLDMPDMLERIDGKMEAAVGAHQATLQRLMDWTHIAEGCGLRRLYSKCVREIAATLARARKGVGPRTMSSQNLLADLPMGPSASADGLHTALSDMALLEGLSVRSKLSIMACLLAALRRMPGDPSALLPGEASLARELSCLKLADSPPVGEDSG